jgi:competence protein ComEC
MYCVAGFARCFGLDAKPLRLLAISFLLQLCAAPGSGSSVSFILSYLALFGIVTLGSLAADLLRGRLPECAASPLSASLGAFVATLAVTGVCFGSIRPVGIVLGLVLVPITTVFMVLAMAYLALAFIPVLAPLASLAGWFLNLLYRILDLVVKIGSALPGVDIPQAPATWALLLAINAVLVCALWAGQKFTIKKLKNVKKNLTELNFCDII